MVLGPTMTSGHWACRAQSWLTEPSANSLKSPRPRDPTTSRSASLLTLTRAVDAGGSTTRATTMMPGARAPAFATASSRIADSRAFSAATASSSMASWRKNVVCTTSRVAPRKHASRAAHSSALSEIGDPSTPTTILGCVASFVPERSSSLTI